MRRVISQTTGIPVGRIRVIKPYVGGGFDNKQDVLYEPLNAFLCLQVGGRGVGLIKDAVIDRENGEILLTIAALADEAFYSLERSVHITAEEIIRSWGKGNEKTDENREKEPTDAVLFHPVF